MLHGKQTKTHLKGNDGLCTLQFWLTPPHGCIYLMANYLQGPTETDYKLYMKTVVSTGLYYRPIFVWSANISYWDWPVLLFIF